jgi:hypothetical protein
MSIIPSAAITIDGPTAWLVVRNHDGWFWETDHNRPCDTCNGQGWFPFQFFTQDYGYQILEDSCIDCHGTGRHTFTIDVQEPCRCKADCGDITQLSVHVVEVLPIHGATEHWPDATHLSLDEGNRTVWLWTWTGQGFDFTRDYCTLSADAASGMYAVRLAIHKGET